MKLYDNLFKNFNSSFVFFKTYEDLCEKNNTNVFDFWISLQKDNGQSFSFKTKILNDQQYDDLTFHYIERLIKTMLWLRGGHTFTLYTHNANYCQRLQKLYQKGGARYWDNTFIVEQIYQRPLVFKHCQNPEDFPKELRSSKEIGGYTNGYRIGFDLGGSDKKITAVDNGKVLFTRSILWSPIEQNDIHWHIREVNEILDMAASYLPRVDAVGASVPGVCENNEVKVSSIFQGLRGEQREQSRHLFSNMIQEKWGVPFGLSNDGDVSALAGAMKFKEKNLLAMAMGTSTACGYINANGRLEDSFNEFAFIPVDFSKEAPNDPWSNDIGCGSQYFSQQAVYRLAKQCGIELDEKLSLAKNLLIVQELVEKRDERAVAVFETIGRYLAHAMGYYSLFYSIDSLLLLGRVLKNTGGNIIVDIFEKEIKLSLPKISIKTYSLSEDEVLHSQAIAASTIPKLSQ